jgi:hypothetical protein
MLNEQITNLLVSFGICFFLTAILTILVLHKEMAIQTKYWHSKTTWQKFLALQLHGVVLLVFIQLAAHYLLLYLGL